MRRRLFVLVFVGFIKLVHAQQQNATWYFGHYAGLKFDSLGDVTVLNDSAMSTRENATCLSDTDGNLLVYSDGCRVYNKYHQQVLHGDTLYSHWLYNGGQYFGVNSLGGSILLPSLEHADEAVMFTCSMYTNLFNGNFPRGVIYNRIDIEGDSVMLPKNQMIYTSQNNTDDLFAEQILAIRHANGRDWWLLTHRLYSDAFWVYLYDPYGIHGPYEQHIGQTYSGSSWLGQLISNREGNRVVATSVTGISDLYDFNRCTGLLSDYIEMGFPPYDAVTNYGFAAFSASGNTLYLANTEFLFQYDLTAPNPKLTETLIYTNNFYNTSAPIDSQTFLGMLQLGADDRIYMAINPGGYYSAGANGYLNNRSKYLGVVNNPDVLGAGCNFDPQGLYLGGNYSTYALPNIAYHLGALIGSGCDTIVENPPPTALFTSDQTAVCLGGCVQLQNQSQSATSYQWLFPGGTPSSSNDAAPSVCYSQAGAYDVTLVATNAFGSDTLVQNAYVVVHPAPTDPVVHRTNDTLFTDGSFAFYQWFRDGVTATLSFDSFCVVSLPGNYTVIVTDTFGCTAQASFAVTNVETVNAFALTLTPNPASASVVCRWSNALVDNVELYDALGRKVLALQPLGSSTVLDVASLFPGVYTLRAVGQQGVAFRRLVVER